MCLEPERGMMRQLGWLLGGALLLFGLACAGVITIEPIPTATPQPTPPPSPVAQSSLTGVGRPFRIVAETIGLDAPVVEMGWKVEGSGPQAVSVWDVPDQEAGWHINSARPGEGSNVVISGHNDSMGSHVFGELENLQVGDEISVWVSPEQTYRYRVSDTQVVRAFGATQEALAYLQTVMEPTPTERLTLITCWPSWTNTHRLIIVAQPL